MAPLSTGDYHDPTTPLAAKVRALAAVTYDATPPPEVKQQVMDVVLSYAMAYTGCETSAQLRQLCQLFRKQERRMVEEAVKRQKKMMKRGLARGPAMHAAQRELEPLANRLLINELIGFPRVERAYRRCADPSSDPSKGYATRMLLDLRATAAVFSEVALTDFEEQARAQDRCTALDLGSGSGIMMLALAVSALRNDVSMNVLGYELIAHHARLAQEVLDAIGLAPEVSFAVNTTNLTATGTLARILDEVDEAGAPLRYWVSETFGYGTPRYSVDEGLVRWHPTSAMGGRAAQQTLDPIQDIVTQTCQHDRGFLERVARGDVRMFPDLTDGSFRPEQEQSTLRLRRFGDAYHDLQDLRTLFEEFEDLGMQDRWSKGLPAPERGAR